jgi:hypothetical protein
MSPMPDFDARPQGPAEELIASVFHGRSADADPQIVRVRLERRLREAQPRKERPALRAGFAVALSVCALFIFGGWAANLTIRPWDDAQQVTIPLPAGWSPASYPRLVGVMSKESDKLYSSGGASLIVDYKRDRVGGYYAQLGLVGVDYQTANDWVRGVLKEVPELQGQGYSITQPLVPYSITVGDMLAFRLMGHSTAVERNVVSAWQRRVETGAHGGRTSRNAVVYLITRDKDYAHRVSMLEY